MLIKWLSIITYFAVQLGFAGVFAIMLTYLRSTYNNRQMAAAGTLGGLVLLSPLSMPTFVQWLAWIAAILVVVLYLWPGLLPVQFYFLPNVWRYAAVSMLLIAVWGAAHGSLLTVISLFALLAAYSAWCQSQVILAE